MNLRFLQKYKESLVGYFYTLAKILRLKTS